MENSFIKIAECFNKIKETSSSNEKKKILESFSGSISDIKIILSLTYDPYIMYYVNKVDLENFNDHALFLGEFDVDALLDYLGPLTERKISGHDALNHVCRIYNLLPVKFQPYLEKILCKDLKIGLATGLINQVFPGLIPEFDLALCERFKKIKLNQIKYPVYVEPKIDGTRALAFVYEDHVEIKARSGIKFENFKVIEQELLAISAFIGYVLDGEIQDVDFQTTMNNARRVHDAQADNAIFKIWDKLSITEFMLKQCKSSLEERKHDLRDIFNYVSNNISFYHLELIPYDICDSFEEILKEFEYWKFEKGEEGVVVKDPHSKYPFKRDRVWWKFKIRDYSEVKGDKSKCECSAQILDYYKGEQGTKYENSLGGFVCKTVINGENVYFNVGGGFSDEQREDFIKRPQDIIEYFPIIDVSYEEVTKNKKGTLSLRHPIFLRIREDLNSIDE
jgi:hypothetical protein